MNDLTLYLWGLSHNTAPIKVREKLAFLEEEIYDTLRNILKEKYIQEAFLLSTCNRTEFYFLMRTDPKAKNKIEAVIRSIRSNFAEESYQFSYYFTGTDAISHLFKVASGLDSMILGESEILGQVKRAFQLAREAGASKVYLNRLLNMVIKTGKKVRAETLLGKGSLNIAFACVELARKIFKDLKEKKTLLIGAGKIGELTAKSLSKRLIKKIYIVNRTYSKAFRVAQDLNAKAIHWEELPGIIKEVDFIICSTGQKEHLITKDFLQKQGITHRPGPVVLVDIAVPRDVDPKVEEIENIFLYDIDDLKDIVQESVKKRKRSVPKALHIIKSQVSDFLNWSQYLEVRPTLIALKDQVNQHVISELSRYKNILDEEQMTLLRQALENLSKKFIRDHAKALREYANGYPDGNLRIDVIREIFGLQNAIKEKK